MSFPSRVISSASPQISRIQDGTGTDAAFVDSNGGLLALPARYSQKTGRTYKTGAQAPTGAGATIYTVTPGKILYVTNLLITAYNAGAGVAGDFRVQDGPATLVLPFALPPAGIGALSAAVGVGGIALIFPEPKQFVVDVRTVITAGTISYALSFTGYEE